MTFLVRQKDRADLYTQSVIMTRMSVIMILTSVTYTRTS
jgi:hypothetical protein